MKLLVATKNRHKFEEIKSILSELNIELICAADIEHLPDTIEDRDTIEGNSIKKAREAALFTHIPAIADDTGFFVSALNDEPGVFAARYAGENCSYADNVNKMLKNMEGIGNREARFETVVSLAFPDKKDVITRKGIINGYLLGTQRGHSGFGYDPIFVPEGFDKTFAELSDDEKNQISHRARAFQAILPVLKELFDK
jgi:XTP/dITP diphosphohydrolase